MSSIEINVPNVKEQEDAVNVLEQVSDIIHSRKQELQMLDDLIKARFVEMFGDPAIQMVAQEAAKNMFRDNGRYLHYVSGRVIIWVMALNGFRQIIYV